MDMHVPTTTTTGSAFVLLLATLCRLVHSYFLAMISDSQYYIINEGESVVLECNFHADRYNLFEQPVLWRKEQQDEDFQVNVLSNINEPFLQTNRFDVSFTSAEPRYRLQLAITGAVREDSGNYTCEVRGTTILAQVVHRLFVRAPVESVRLSSDTNPVYSFRSSSTFSSTSSYPSPTSSIIHLTEGVPSSIRCAVVGGYPPPTIQLFVDRRDVTAHFTASTSHVKMFGTPGLRLLTHESSRGTNSYEARSTDDGAPFKCSATVPGLAPRVYTARLDINYAPKITCRPTEANIDDQDVYLLCDIKAKPHVTADTVFWLLSDTGTTLRSGEVMDEFSSVTKVGRDDSTEAVLYIRRALPDRFRLYTIVAENSVAITRRDIQLLQNFKSYGRQTLSDAASSSSSGSHIAAERVVSRDTVEKSSSKHAARPAKSTLDKPTRSGVTATTQSYRFVHTLTVLMITVTYNMLPFQ